MPNFNWTYPHDVTWTQAHIYTNTCICICVPYVSVCCVCIFCVWIYEMRHCICMSDVKYISSACGKRANIERMERKNGGTVKIEKYVQISMWCQCARCVHTKSANHQNFRFFFFFLFLLVDCVSVCNFENPQRTGIGDSTWKCSGESEKQNDGKDGSALWTVWPHKNLRL